MSQEEGFVIEHEGLFLGSDKEGLLSNVGFFPKSPNTYFFPQHIYANCKDELETVSAALAASNYNATIPAYRCRALKANRVRELIFIEDLREGSLAKVVTNPNQEHPVYTFQCWRNFTMGGNWSVPYGAFVAICEFAEEVRKYAK